jgi:glycosyltransferase involved in cell wall biosynthesis
MYAGLPIVASRVPALPEVLDGVDCWLCSPDEPQEFTQALINAIGIDEFERKDLSEGTIKLANQRFSRNRMVSEFALAYQELSSTVN